MTGNASVPVEALRGSTRDFRFPSGSDLLLRCDAFFEWQDVRRKSGTWPYSRSTQSGAGVLCAVRDDRGFLSSGVNFASQDYLSLSSHPAVVAAAKRATDELGVHSAGSPALAGNTAASVELEARLAEFVQMEHALLFPTGWAAGFGAIKGLVRSRDCVVMDALSHSCLQTGAQAATSNVFLFRHLDLDDCRKKLAKGRAASPDAGIMLVTESLFSMDSDTPDLAAMQDLAREFGATFLVDCAHDLGNIGPGGTGHLGLQGMLGQVDLVMGSFSKTFASNGGFIATNSRAVKEYLLYYSPSCTFSNALSPVQSAAITTSLDIVQSDEGETLRSRMMRNAELLREDVQARGMEVYGDPSAIVAVKTGDEARARLTARELPALGLMANLVEFPAVPKGQARFRLQIMAGHGPSEIGLAAACLQKAMATADQLLGEPRADSGSGIALVG